MFLRTRFAGSVGAALAAGLLVAAFGPANAAPQPGRAASGEVSDGTSAAPAAKDPKADTRRYCIRYQVSGTRIEKQRCQSRAEWLDEGIDVDNPGA